MYFIDVKLHYNIYICLHSLAAEVPILEFTLYPLIEGSFSIAHQSFI